MPCGDIGLVFDDEDAPDGRDDHITRRVVYADER
jgi:hypothetical protein